jgi:hypothetical protein
MRWMWVDRFTEFVSGSHASGTKNVALDQDVLDEYCPGFPYLPPTLIIEGMAQLGGILVAEMFDWDKRVVLAKVGKAEFFFPALFMRRRVVVTGNRNDQPDGARCVDRLGGPTGKQKWRRPNHAVRC